MNPEDVRMGRAALNWSLDQLAEETGVHRNTIANIETGKSVGSPATLAAIKAKLEASGVIFSDAGGRSSVSLRRFQVGDMVRFRAQSRVPQGYLDSTGKPIIGQQELGRVTWVEPDPHMIGPTYMIEVHFDRVRLPRIFKFEFELVQAVAAE